MANLQNNHSNTKLIWYRFEDLKWTGDFDTKSEGEAPQTEASSLLWGSNSLLFKLVPTFSNFISTKASSHETSQHRGGSTKKVGSQFLQSSKSIISFIRVCA